MTSARVVRLSEVRPATPAKPPARAPARLSWGELVAREPRLARLRREIRALHRQPLGDNWCAGEAWYGYGAWRWSGGEGFRRRLAALVGTTAERPDPVLRRSKAYDLAYRMLYEALPDCRDCACARPQHYR